MTIELTIEQCDVVNQEELQGCETEMLPSRNCAVTMRCKKHFQTDSVSFGYSMGTINHADYKLDARGTSIVAAFDRGENVVGQAFSLTRI